MLFKVKYVLSIYFLDFKLLKSSYYVDHNDIVDHNMYCLDY